MTIVGMDDVAAVTMSKLLTWETATDWDNAVSESGVVHEAFGDLEGAGTLTLGYPSFDRGGTSLWSYHPFDEDTGTTADDVSSNNRDASINGPALGAGGIFGTAFDYDGIDDNVDTGVTSTLESGSFTLTAWVNFPDVTTSGQRVIHADANGDGWALSVGDPGTGIIRFFIRGMDSVSLDSATALSTNTWYHIAAVRDATNSDRYIYINGTEDAANTTDSGTPLDSTGTVRIGTDGSSGTATTAIIDAPRIHSRALSATEVSNRHAAATSGVLTTATKSYPTAKTPDVQSLDYTLNQGSITLDVIGSPGTASEEVKSVSLDGTQTSAALTWTDPHADFRLRPNLSTTNPPDTAPVFRAGTLVG